MFSHIKLHYLHMYVLLCFALMFFLSHPLLCLHPAAGSLPASLLSAFPLHASLPTSYFPQDPFLSRLAAGRGLRQKNLSLINRTHIKMLGRQSQADPCTSLTSQPSFYGEFQANKEAQLKGPGWMDGVLVFRGFLMLSAAGAMLILPL